MPDNKVARVNPLIDLLEEDKPIFSLWVNYYGVGADYQTAAAIQANPYYDFLLYDLEHQAYDLGQLRRFLWDLLDPATLETAGRRAIKPVIPRIPPSGRENNLWVIKQVLDMGVAGLMFPHIETADQAMSAIAAARYAQKPGAADYYPQGLRGYSPALPARYWGLSADDYQKYSDVWGVDPDGNLLLIFIIESKRGVDNVREIAAALQDANVKAILWCGGGDMAISYGESAYTGGGAETQAGVEAVLAAGREFGLPVGMNGYLAVEADYEGRTRLLHGGTGSGGQLARHARGARRGRTLEVA